MQLEQEGAAFFDGSETAAARSPEIQLVRLEICQKSIPVIVCYAQKELHGDLVSYS
jgi:hypothetical protein